MITALQKNVFIRSQTDYGLLASTGIGFHIFCFGIVEDFSVLHVVHCREPIKDRDPKLGYLS